MQEASIFGIEHSNRKKEEFFGKNQFNSSFPVGLANYMLVNNIPARYIKLKDNLKTEIVNLPIDELFCAKGKKPEDLYFGFESVFAPFKKYATDEPLDGIDLVVSDNATRTQLCPLEVKLTVLPDNTTVDFDVSKWGAELVIRPATTEYCVFNMRNSLGAHLKEIFNLFDPVCKSIDDWNNEAEVSAVVPKLIPLINEFEKRFLGYQRPLIMQPVWKTKGKSPALCEDAFDIFVWSDFAFTRLFMDRMGKANAKISRPQRCAVRFARALYELSVSSESKISVEKIYRKMAYSQQSDKEFAASGRITNQYFSSVDFAQLSVKRDAVYKIISNEGIKKLSPERRFDQSVYFTMAEK